MKRSVIVFAAIAILCIFVSCGRESGGTISLQQSSTISDKRSDAKTDSDATDTLVSEQVSVGFGIDYPKSQNQLMFDGGKVNARLILDGDEKVDIEVGVVMYINGINQQITYEESTEYIHKITLSPNEHKEIDISFLPLAGKKGDVQSVVFGAMLSPSFVAKDEYRTYGNSHRITTFGKQSLVLNADCGEDTVDILDKFTQEPMPQEFIDEMLILNDDGTVYRNRLDSFTVSCDIGKEGNIIGGDDKITFSLYGGESNTYRVSVYVDHKLVENAFDGCPYADIKTEELKISSVTFTPQQLGMKSDDFVYFIAIPTKGAERELYKTDNITYIEE